MTTSIFFFVHGSSIDVCFYGFLDRLTGVAGFGPVALRPRQRPCGVAKVRKLDQR